MRAFAAMNDGPDFIPNQQLDIFGDLYADTPHIQRDVLAHSLHNTFADMSLHEVVSIITNRYNETLDYLALAIGQSRSQKTSLLFNPHRLDTRTATSQKSLYQALCDPAFHSGLARVTLYKQGRVAELFYQAIQLGINGIQYVNEYPPAVARDLCRGYRLNTDSCVLDPCAGWGGRMIGCSVVVGNYTGYEPASKTVAGLLELRNFIQNINHNFQAAIHCQPYEDSTERVGFYDFAITSPPYYDTEIYSDEPTNSLNRYHTFESWCAGFYLPLIDKTMRQLKPGAPFVINIGDRRYPLSERLHRHAADRYTIRNLSTRLSGIGGLGKDGVNKGAGEAFYEIREMR